MGVSAGATDAPALASWSPPQHGVAGMLRRAVAALAVRAPVRTFVVEGVDVPAPTDALRTCRDVQCVDTPRSAVVLLLAGCFPPALADALQRAHDAMAHPRAVVWWTRDADGPTAPLPGLASLRAVRVVAGAPGDRITDDAVAGLALALRDVQRALLYGTRVSDPALLPDVDPAPWRGVGPFGQGGAGMTGGVPYGRPMVGRAPDRDGLELDQLPVRVGPFFSAFPPGLVLEVKLQGDIVQEAVVPGNAFAGMLVDRPRSESGEPPRIAELERARARHLLRWLAHALRVHGLDALGRRTLALVAALGGELPAAAAVLARITREVAALERLLARTRALDWATAGVGVTPPADLAGRGLGPVARAAGVVDDARLDDPTYLRLGFEPVVAGDGAGDARARWRQRLAETVQSLALAARAGDARAGVGAEETPRGRGATPNGVAPFDARTTPSTALLALLPDLLRDQEWGDAVTTVVSLDLDVREAAAGAAPLAPPPSAAPANAMGGMAGMGGEHAPGSAGHGGGGM